MLLQHRSERKKWEREQIKLAYSNALKALSKATIIPTGVDAERLRKWFDCLSEVRESVIALQVYASTGQKRIEDCCKILFDVMEENDYVLMATTAADIVIDGKPDGVVLFGVGRIRLAIVALLTEVTQSARHDLKRALTA